MTLQPVSKQLQLFVRMHINKEASLQGLEAGGRGDCLFHSIGAALEQMLQGDPVAATHLRARCDVGIFQKSTQHVVQFLRNVTAESLLHWEDAALLNLLACCSLSERSGDWQDGWSPSRLLRTHNFGELVGCDAVRAVGPNPHPNADRDDIVVALTRSSAHAGAAASDEILLPIPEGASYFAALKASLRDEFKVSGNHHWGTVTDCAAISEKLDVGMLIFVNNLQNGGTQCLVNVDASRGNYAYYICLWWDDPRHFRLAQYQESNSMPWRSFWKAEDMPQSLRAHYDICNHAAPVGSARRVGLS